MKKSKGHSVIRDNLFILKRIYAISPRKVWGEVAIQLFGKCKMYIFNIFYPLYIYKAIQNNREFPFVLKQIGISMLVILAVDLFTDYYNNCRKPILDLDILKKTTFDLYRKRVQLDYCTHENRELNERINQVAVNLSKTFNETQESFLLCIFDTIYVFITLQMMIAIDKWTMVFVVIPVIISFYVGAKVNKNQYNLLMDLVEEERKLTYVKETFFNRDSAKEIKLTNIGRALTQFLNDAYKKSVDHIKKTGSVIGYQQAIMETLGRYVIYIGAFIYITYSVVVLKTIDLGEFYFLFYSIITLSWFLTGTIRNILLLGKNSLFIEQYKEFWDIETNIETTSGIKVDVDSGIIFEFRNVYFKYFNEDRYVLENVNMTFSEKEKIALVGFNGAGKTTIIKLMLRLYDVTEGEILLNGRNIKEYDISSYRSLFGTVFQDFQIYENKLSTNIAMERDIDEERLVESSKKAGVYERIDALPDQYDTVYSKEFDERGVIFSGGEKQKLAIARAFYNSKRIAIFDEPSSSLDPFSERQIFEKMISNSDGLMTIIVSHRLSSATLADKVYFIEHGRVLEEGSHESLIAKGGKYCEVFKTQASSYTMKENY